MRTLKPRILLFCSLLLASALGNMGMDGVPVFAFQNPPSQSTLPTFIERPADTVKTYTGSILYKRAQPSPEVSAAIMAQVVGDWEKYGIAQESNLGLPLGSIFLRAKSGKYVELALYERAAFTIFEGKPARQILAAALARGRIQVTVDEFIPLPLAVKLALLRVPIVGDGGSDTPTVEVVAKMLTSDKARALDADATLADQQLKNDGTVVALSPTMGVEPLLLGQPDDVTGHRIPQVMAASLSRLFGGRVLQNAGLPLSQAIWVSTTINGVRKSICIQVFERLIITYNPDNDEHNRVQVGLWGAVLYKGLTIDAGQIQMKAPKVSKLYLSENHMPVIGPQGPPLYLGGVLEVEDVAGFDFGSPDNRVTLLRPTGEMIISSKARLGIYQIPGNPRPYQVSFNDDRFNYSPVPLVCGEVLYGLLEIRYRDSAVIVQLPYERLSCPE